MSVCKLTSIIRIMNWTEGGLQFIGGVPLRQVTRSIILFLLVLIPALATAWEENESWSDIGTVQQWMDLDARFYRVEDDGPFLQSFQFSLDQKKAFKESQTWDSGLPEPCSLDQFLAFSPEEKQHRRKVALKEIKPVAGFFQVHLSRLQLSRENRNTDMGTPVQDLKHLGDSLRQLGHAVGVDPANYYAWHLLGYFSACCGDVQRSHSALESAAEALNEVPQDVHLEIKQRVMLDLAWLEREQGFFEKALKRLEVAAKLGKETAESRLLRGLIAAQTGDQQTALRFASELRSQPVRVYPVDLTTAALVPLHKDTSIWKTLNSDYMQAWIIALLELQKGDSVAAGRAFREYSTLRLYPLADRFWDEAGLIYERTDRNDLSATAWKLAINSQPWIQFMLHMPYGIRLGELTGNSHPSPYFLGFDSFFLVGNRLAYGASLVGLIPVVENPEDKQALAARALDQLEICQRSGQYPGPASVLQGQVYFLMGDMASAKAELKQAQSFFEIEGDQVNLASVQKDLAIIQQNLDIAGIKKFYSQSGRSRGRWDVDEDPAATEEVLVTRLDKNPADDATKLELARHYIRNGQTEQGRRLAFSMYNPDAVDEQTVEVVTLILEADRILGLETMAKTMIHQLDKGEVKHWDNADLWSLVSAICQDHDRINESRKALEMALKLDPENQGIRNQLQVLD